MKRIIVCCDGTWNADDTQTNDTNVALLARAIYGSQQTDVLQIGLYLRGVGTTGLKLETWIEGTTGIGVDGNIRSAYQFIGQNYVPGDEIYLFGFSRGAFILAGLITAYGILFRQSLNGLPDAWIYYRSPKPHSRPLSPPNTNYSVIWIARSRSLACGIPWVVSASGQPARCRQQRKSSHFMTTSLAAREARRPGAGDRRAPAGFEVTSVIQAGKYDES
jgi:hypothetical protein